jgi:hypothetical protein
MQATRKHNGVFKRTVLRIEQQHFEAYRGPQRLIARGH